MRSIVKFLCFLALALAPTRSVASDAVAVTDSGLNGININSYIEHYVEPTYVPLDRSLKILSKLDQFKPLPEEPRLGHKDTPIWFTLEMVNRSSKDADLFLQLPRQYFWQIRE